MTHGEQLRTAMRQVPSAVTVVTVAGADEVRGITIGSFTSVSLDPPLISFNVALDAQVHDLLIRADHFVVHILADEQAHLSNHFAEKDRTGEEQFATIPHHLGTDGTPILEGVLAVFFCTHFAVFPVGDHSLLVGEVVHIDQGHSGTPLVYFERSYHRVGGEVQDQEAASVKRFSSATSYAPAPKKAKS
jgi:flavin reductase (DIM6/NTAB) family NADH-FMN oxidoreductase RutF